MMETSQTLLAQLLIATIAIGSALWYAGTILERINQIATSLSHIESNLVSIRAGRTSVTGIQHLLTDIDLKLDAVRTQIEPDSIEFDNSLVLETATVIAASANLTFKPDSDDWLEKKTASILIDCAKLGLKYVRLFSEIKGVWHRMSRKEIVSAVVLWAYPDRTDSEDTPY